MYMYGGVRHYVATLVRLPYFTLINSVKGLTKLIKVKYGNIISVATYPRRMGCFYLGNGTCHPRDYITTLLTKL